MPDTAVIGLTLALAVQFGGLVWGAARLASAVDSLRETAGRLAGTVDKLSTTVGELDKRVTVIEALSESTK